MTWSRLITNILWIPILVGTVWAIHALGLRLFFAALLGIPLGMVFVVLLNIVVGTLFDD